MYRAAVSQNKTADASAHRPFDGRRRCRRTRRTVYPLAQTAATPTAIVGIHSGLIAPPLELSTRGQLNLWPPRTTAARGSVTSGRSEADRRVDLREHRAGHRARPVGAVGEDPLQLSAIGHVLAEPLAQRGDKRLERVGGVGLQRPVLRA